MKRRLFKAGNSIVLSLPKEALDSLGLCNGASVHLELDLNQRRLIITPANFSLDAAGVNMRFSQQVDEFIDLYRPALDELARGPVL